MRFWGWTMYLVVELLRHQLLQCHRSEWSLQAGAEPRVSLSPSIYKANVVPHLTLSTLSTKISLLSTSLELQFHVLFLRGERHGHEGTDPLAPGGPPRRSRATWWRRLKKFSLTYPGRRRRLGPERQFIERARRKPTKCCTCQHNGARDCHANAAPSSRTRTAYSYDQLLIRFSLHSVTYPSLPLALQFTCLEFSRNPEERSDMIFHI